MSQDISEVFGSGYSHLHFVKWDIWLEGFVEYSLYGLSLDPIWVVGPVYEQCALIIIAEDGSMGTS